MALDSDQLFSSAQSLAADGFSTNAVAVNKTPAEGVLIEVDLTLLDTLTKVEVTAYERAADSGWATTDPVCGKLRAITAVGRYFFLVQSKLKYVKLYYDVTGTPGSITVTAGPATGGQRDMVA
jgi:hypothetical protein